MCFFTKPFFLIFFIAAFVASASAVEKIEDFLGLKFGTNHATAKEAMLARGSKLKDDKSLDQWTFTGGTYAGEKITELTLHFTADHFDRAEVTLKYSVDKSNDKGLAMFDALRASLTEKFGPPASAAAVGHGKNSIEKAKATQLETIWQNKDALSGEHRSVTLRVPGIGMYDWSFQIIYQDHKGTGKSTGPAPRKDI